jgi:hypothetical protein
MKRLMISVCFVFLFTGGLLFSESKFFFTVQSDYFQITKNNYTGQSGKKKVFIEGKAAVRLFGNFYGWGSYGFFPIKDSWTEWSGKNVFEKDVNVDRTLKKRVFSLGAGYFIGFFEPNEFAVKTEIGICSITNIIDSSYSYISSKAPIRSTNGRQSGIGLRTNLGVTYGLLKNVFGEVAMSFMIVSDTKDSVKSNLGGFSLSAGLGIVL